MKWLWLFMLVPMLACTGLAVMIIFVPGDWAPQARWVSGVYALVVGSRACTVVLEKAR